jgi:hypothetical protein
MHEKIIAISRNSGNSIAYNIILLKKLKFLTELKNNFSIPYSLSS